MAYSTVSSKGQVTIPSQVRERMGIYQGTQLLFVDDGDRILVYKVEGDLESAYGCVALQRARSPVDFKALSGKRAAKYAAEETVVGSLKRGARTG